MRNPTTCNTVVSNSDVGSFNLEQRLSRRYFFVIAGAALLAGCQSQQHTPAPRPTSTPLPALQPITPQNAQHLVQVAELDAGGVAVRSLAWPPDGSILAVGAYPNVQLWDDKAGQRLATLKGHTGQVNGLAWSHDGSMLASASDDSTVRIWNPGQHTTLKVLQPHPTTSVALSLAWSPDGGLLAVTDDSGAVEIWDGKTLKDQVNMLAHPEAGWCFGVSWSPDGRMVAGARQGGLVQVWDAVTHKELAALTGHTRAAWTLAWSPDNLHIASGSDDTTVRLWGVH